VIVDVDVVVDVDVILDGDGDGDGDVDVAVDESTPISGQQEPHAIARVARNGVGARSVLVGRASRSSTATSASVGVGAVRGHIALTRAA
jgi:hypothetical protein